MIPYVHVPSLDLGFITIHPFGVLVAIAVLLGTSLATRRAKRLGLDVDKLGSFVTWMLVSGFIGGHVLDAIVYRPDEVLRRPAWLLEIWNGQGSSGGFIGAAAGVLAWKYFETVPWIRTPFFAVPWFRKREQPEPILALSDLILSVFPVAWVFGRMGCAVAHDHVGVRADHGALLAVAHGPFDASMVTHLPFGIELRNGTAPRYDLGTLELFFTIVLASVLVATWRRRLPVGWYIAFVSLAYAPVRFAMEFLRVQERDPRYALLTPAQWACLALFGFGAIMMARLHRTRISAA